MARLWLYKWNERGRFHEGQVRNWSHVFAQGQPTQGFGFANPVGRSLIQVVEPGDEFIAYQTDERVAVGLCRITGVNRDGENPSIEFQQVRAFPAPVPLHELKKKSEALRGIKALRQGLVQSLYALSEEEATTLLRACDDYQAVGTTALDELRLVKDSDEIEQSLRTFNRGAVLNAERARSLLRNTDYWIYSPTDSLFGPGKFVGLAGMTFRRYDAYEALNRAGQAPSVFDGGRTHRAIEQVTKSSFQSDDGLTALLRTWGERLLGKAAFGEASDLRWKFLRLPSPRMIPFSVGDRYTRQDVYRVLGVPVELQGGNWDTGYTRYDDEWYIFSGIGIAGRTGHDYGNHWVGDDLFWRGKTNSKLQHESIQSLVSGTSRVHLFTREHDRDPFTYEGTVFAREAMDTSPVTVTWQLRDTGNFPDEVPGDEHLMEGMTKSVEVNVYERNPMARRRCIAHYGPRCQVCGVDFGERYGEIGNGFIHVHHLKQLSEIGEQYEVDPIADLRPICPNCHAMVHRTTPPLLLEEVRRRLQQ